MSKIEEYQVARWRATNVRRAVDRATGADSPQNDKHLIECSFVEQAKTDWNPAILRFRASHGYYGNSSCSSDISEDVGRYVAKAITQMGEAIMQKAAALAEADAEEARRRAQIEAREVLEATL